MIKKIIYLFRRKEKKIVNYTNKFWKMFKDNAKNPDFSMIIWEIGTRGSGITTTEMMIANELLITDPLRKMALFQLPEAVLKTIQGKVPPELKNRVRIIKQLQEIKNNDILLINLDLIIIKAGLINEIQNLGKFMSYTRHKRIFLIISCFEFEWLKELHLYETLKSMADMKLYKGLSPSFADKSEDSFVRKYQQPLIDLKKDQALFVSSYKYFRCEGILTFDLNRCPWCSN